MSDTPVLRNFAYCLAHVPDLVRHGSKPRRELLAEPGLEPRLAAAARSFARAAAYPPNRAFLGDLPPRALGELPRPWFETPAAEGVDAGPVAGRFGEIVDQETFYALLQRADVLEPPLLQPTEVGAARLASRRDAHPLLAGDARGEAAAAARGDVPHDPDAALPLYSGDACLGVFRRDERAEGRDDDNLRAPHLLENLSAKASGALALHRLLAREGIEPERIDYLVSCGEEACGDRYQRGGGGMAKAIGEMCGCTRASGMDVKNFCAAPASALVTAAALVKAGLYENVAVVAGGSVAKLGMKFQAFLQRDMPILEDCLASLALLVRADDGESPVLRLERGAVGAAPIGASTSDEAVYRSLLLGPLEALGLRIADVDRFAPELHNPEIMEFAGSGDVATKNYRAIAAMAVVDGQLAKREMDEFVARVGMPGFAPTQGHVPSAVAYLGHASESIRRGEIRRAMFLAKASLFLGRCTDLFDGVSFLLEANPAARP